MSGLSPERREELAQAILDEHRARLGFEPIPVADCAGPDDYTRPANAVAPLIAGWLAAEREAGAAEVRARVEALADLWAGSDPDREFILGDEYAADLRAALNGGES